MTPDELRALDRRVAELRGMTRVQNPKCSYQERFPSVPIEQWSCGGQIVICNVCGDDDVPAYSTDPRASRMLLDEMAAAPASLGISSYRLQSIGPAWRVHAAYKDQLATGEGDTLDAAICLAWIAWREAQG